MPTIYNKVTAGNQILIDLSQDTVTDASHIVAGHTGHLADGTQVAGTGGGSVEVEEKQVNFIDYDGTILYSYTKAEANALTALPSNPSHTGLTAQGWNWTLQQIKSQLTNVPDGPVWVGQNYTTASGKTELDIVLDDYALKPYIFFAINGTVVIDWGDGTSTTTVTGTSNTTLKYTQHTYSTGGKYTIFLNVTSGKLTFYNNNTDYRGVFSERNNYPRAGTYSWALKAARIGPNTNLGQQAFHMCVGLETISLPTTATFGTYALGNCRKLKSATIPNTVTSTPTYLLFCAYYLINVSLPGTLTVLSERTLSNIYFIKEYTIPYGVTTMGNGVFRSSSLHEFVYIPNTVTSIGEYCFENNVISKITIPASVTSISGYAFNKLYTLDEFHFLGTTPPTITSTTFSNTSTAKKIYVPTSAVATYKGASNWSSQASYIYGE